MWLWNVYCRAERGGKTGWSAFFWNIILGLNTVKSGKWWFYLGKATFSHLRPFTLHKLCSAWTQIDIEICKVRHVFNFRISISWFSIQWNWSGGPLLPAGDDLWYHPNFSRSETPHKIMPHSCTDARQDPSSGIIPICSGRGGQHITSSQPPRCRATGTSNTQHRGI